MKARSVADENEFLALDNLMLARRTAELEKRLELATLRDSTGGGSLTRALFGFSSSAQQQLLEDAATQLHARADENLQLQHMLFEQQRDALAERERQVAAAAAAELALRATLADTEAEETRVRTKAAAEAADAARVIGEQRSNIDSIHSVCLELRLKCEATLDDLEASNAAVDVLRQRDAEHQEWRARVRVAWQRELQERAEQEAEAQKALDAPRDAEAAAAAAAASSTNSTPPPTPAQVAAEAPEPDWLEAAGRAVSLPYITEALDSNDGTTEASSSLLLPEGENDPDKLRTALVAERARREAAEAKAVTMEEELALSNARFQQQIAMLSDALTEMHAKEEARKKRQQELREQQRRRQQQEKMDKQQQQQQQQQDGGGPGMLGTASSWLSSAPLWGSVLGDSGGASSSLGGSGSSASGGAGLNGSSKSEKSVAAEGQAPVAAQAACRRVSEK